MWYVDGNNVARVSPAGTETATQLCHSAGCFTAPVWIAAAPDGAMWFSEANPQDVARIAPSGSIRRYTLPHAHPGPQGIAVRPDCKVWVAALLGAVYLLDPAAYDASRLPHPTIALVAKKPDSVPRARTPRRARW